MTKVKVTKQQLIVDGIGQLKTKRQLVREGLIPPWFKHPCVKHLGKVVNIFGNPRYIAMPESPNYVNTNTGLWNIAAFIK